MKYKTIVDKNESSLLQIIQAAERFNAGGFLESLRKRNLSTYEIDQLTDEVKEYQLKMNREVKALVKFSENFLDNYATENNHCYETAEQLFNHIRSTISAARKVLRKTCPRRMHRQPEGKERPLFYLRSTLTIGTHAGDLFGVESFELSVQTLFHHMTTFFATVINTLALCHRMIVSEREIRGDASRCMAIYNDTCAKLMDEVTQMSRWLGEMKQLPESALLKRKRQARSEKAFARENYHQYTPAELKQMLVIEMVKKGQSDGLTDEEALLWPNDHEQALKVRRVIPLIDQLGAEGLKGKMDSGLIIEFLKWCKVDSKLEKRLYQYFCRAYKEQGGRLQVLGWSSISQVRKDRRDREISDEEQAASFERLLSRIA
jgi:uncharacterized protein involved in tolerance to divalent cations